VCVNEYLHEVDLTNGVRCVPQESYRLLGVTVCVSGSRTLGVRFNIGVFLEDTDPLLGLRVAALEEESLESGLGSVNGH